MATENLSEQLKRIDVRTYKDRVFRLMDSWEDHVDPSVIGEVVAREVTGDMLDEIHLMLRVLLSQKITG